MFRIDTESEKLYLYFGASFVHRKGLSLFKTLFQTTRKRIQVQITQTLFHKSRFVSHVHDSCVEPRPVEVRLGGGRDVPRARCQELGGAEEGAEEGAGGGAELQGGEEEEEEDRGGGEVPHFFDCSHVTVHLLP